MHITVLSYNQACSKSERHAPPPSTFEVYDVQAIFRNIRNKFNLTISLYVCFFKNLIILFFDSNHLIAKTSGLYKEKSSTFFYILNNLLGPRLAECAMRETQSLRRLYYNFIQYKNGIIFQKYCSLMLQRTKPH